MDHSRSTTVIKIFNAETIVASGVAYSQIFDVKKLAGNASLHITDLTGDGVCKFEWIGSNDPDAVVADFIKVNNTSDIVTAFEKNSGPGADGAHIYPFETRLVSRMAIKATETSTTDSIVITAILAVQ